MPVAWRTGALQGGAFEEALEVVFMGALWEALHTI